jgi:DNA-binding NarL/FixJ family response regulator/DMSO/TMAO reductase YedYZ heme-binding membrane subunit
MIRILIVDDLNLICKGLEMMFATETDIQIVGFAHNGQEAIEKITKTKPDIVLIDVLMPVMGGIEATRKITQQFPEVKVIVLSTFEDDPTIIDAIKAGAKGYLIKNMNTEDLTAAIRAVERGSSHLAPGVLDSLAKNIQIKPTPSPTAIKAPEKKKTIKPEQLLFKYGDWATVVLAVGVLSQLPGTGHHLGHAGLFFLMLALIARSIRFWWDTPMKHRRAIGIFAFAATLGHAIYASRHVLNYQISTIFSMSWQHQWGLWAGIISLAAMTPAAATSFKYWQQKLGKKWRTIHLWSVPALALAVLHTVMLGPHYLANLNFNPIDFLRSYGIICAGLLVLAMRRQFFWSMLNFTNKKQIDKPA